MSNPITNQSTAVDEAAVLQILQESGALLEGHFLLTSGRHSNRYIEKFRLLEKPQLTSQLCAEIARRFENDNIECVAGPVTGGIILAFEVARRLGCRAVYAERSADGKDFVLRRGFTIEPNERVLVVEDIVTTGGSARKVVHTIQEEGGNVVAVSLLVDRSGGSADYGVERVEPLLRMDIESWEPEEVPPEITEKYGPAIKPGSNKIAGKNS